MCRFGAGRKNGQCGNQLTRVSWKMAVKAACLVLIKISGCTVQNSGIICSTPSVFCFRVNGWNGQTYAV